VEQVKKHRTKGDDQKRLTTFVADIKQRRNDYLDKLTARLDAQERFISEFLEGRISLRDLERNLRECKNKDGKNR
jgi:hypothetical protein